MTYLQVFLNSIKLPNKEAMFRLNRIGMDVALIYIFIILAIVCIPELINRLTATSGFGAELNFIFQLIYFFMFYYLPLTIIALISLSLIAYIGKGIAFLMQRKLRFPILWKLSAFTTTIPLLLYTIITLIIDVSDIFLFVAFVYTIGLVIKMISVYPKRRVRN
jgi:hypothetical protein